MADATVRVSGMVLNIDVRTGTGRQSGEPYRITTARVLVEETGVADVRIPDAMAVPARGSVVDYLADASVFSNRTQLSAIRDLAA